MGNWISWIMGNSTSKAILETKHVVIVGGGYGGVELGVELMKIGIPFTLIDPKDFFHHNVAALRSAVNPEWMKNSAIEFKKTFGDKFVRGKVTGINLEAKKVQLDNGQEIEFTDLVIAVGSDSPFPGKPTSTSLEDATKEYLELSEEIEKANDIFIIGGGAVGVEIAGEIGDKYIAKKMTLIHPKSELVGPGFTAGFQANIKWSLESCHQVQLILEDRVENLSELVTSKCQRQIVKTQKGKSIECDLVLKCTGMRACNSMTKTVFDESKFDENGRLKVNEYLQIEGYENIFAIGDCTNTPEHKMAAHASTHAALIVTNLQKQLKNQPLQPYKQAFDGMIVTVGTKAGAGQINGWNLPVFAVGLAKGKTLFTSKFWALMGQPMPQ